MTETRPTTAEWIDRAARLTPDGQLYLDGRRAAASDGATSTMRARWEM